VGSASSAASGDGPHGGSTDPQRHRRPRVPDHRLDPPVPIVARIVWAEDGEEYIETEAAAWSGQLVYVRLPDRRYRLTSVWLDAVDRHSALSGWIKCPARHCPRRPVSTVRLRIPERVPAARAEAPWTPTFRIAGVEEAMAHPDASSPEPTTAASAPGFRPAFSRPRRRALGDVGNEVLWSNARPPTGE
jgi:hypothetical protein